MAGEDKSNGEYLQMFYMYIENIAIYSSIRYYI